MTNLRDFLNSFLVKKILKSFTIYSGANFINQAIPFLLLPILTRFLTPKDYGILATFIAMLGIVNVIVSMGTTDAIMRGYFDRGKSNFNFSKYIFNASFINFIVFLILFTIIFFSKSFISQKLFIPANWQFLLPVIGFCMAIYNIPFKLFVFQQKPFPYAATQLSSTLIEIMLSIFFVVILSLDWRGRVLGATLNKILFFIISLYILIKNRLLQFSLDFNYIKNILRYGIPVFFHSLGSVIIATVDRFFLNIMVGVSTTGVYSVGYSVAMIIGFLAGAFSLAWNPLLFEKLNQVTDELKMKLVRFAYLYFIVILAMAVILIVIAPYFLRFFIGRNFYGASQFIFWIGLGFAVYGMSRMVRCYILYTKKTYLIGIATFIATIVNIIFNYILIKLNGPIGAAQATFLSYLVNFILTWYFSQKVYPMPWFSLLRPLAYPLQHNKQK